MVTSSRTGRKYLRQPTLKAFCEEFSCGPIAEILPFRAREGGYILFNELPQGFAETTGAKWQRECRRPAFTRIFFGFTITQPHRSARSTQSTRERAVLARIEDVMKLIGISSYPRRKGDA
jgi:hypothetical protein